MEQNKNIDKLFKERFAKHEVTPPPHVWENIQTQLQEKKKDRVIIPLWWKVGGIAAALALLFTLGNTLLNNTNNGIVEETPVIEKEMDATPEIKKDLELNTNENASQVAESTASEILETQTITEQQSTTTPSKKNTSTTFKKNQKVPYTTTQTGVATVVKNNKTKNSATQETIAKNTPNKTSVTNKTDNDFKTTNEVPKTQDAVVAKNNTNKKSTTTKNPQIKEDVVLPTNKEETAVAKTTTETRIQEKQSIFDAIEEQKEIEAKEAVAKTNTPQDRWEIAPNIAPVYYSSLSEGSSIDPSFADNSQSSDVNISYGVGVSYALNDKLKIRSGVSNVALSYSTGGLELGDGPVSAALKNIDYNRSSGSVVIAQDQGTFAMQEDGTFGQITPKSTNGEAFINQNISYYEVPLELSYALINNKFGIDVIGGVSTLFLGDNEVSVNAGDFNETLGAANNLSGLSFATNVGLGMHYNLSKKFKFNVEPMFKYQLNPYTDSSVDFQPFYVGVYTGLSFKF